VVDALPAAPAAEAPVAREGARPRRERYPGDAAVATVALALLASTFLPWYRGLGVQVTGFGSGTWGPAIAFLAGLSAALVGVRRLWAAVSLPVEESLVHEAVGWVALVGTVLKTRFHDPALGLAFGTWVGLGCSVALIVLAGRMSPRAPLVLRPGWARGPHGRVGAALLVVALGGAIGFGVTRSADLAPRALVPERLPGEVRGRLPDCLGDFPVPEGVRVGRGFGGTVCAAELSSARPVAELGRAWPDALRAAGWTFSVVQQTEQVVVITTTAPRCASLAIVGAPGQATTAAQVALGPCPGPT
jgi:hypothetical protein